MKLLVTVLLCFVTAQGAVVSNPEAEVRQTALCIQRSGVSRDSLRRLNRGEFEEDPKLKEYLWCVTRYTGFLDERGYVQSDVTRIRLKGSYYSDETIEEVVQQCTGQKETPQETAFHFMKCVYENTIKQHYS